MIRPCAVYIIKEDRIAKPLSPCCVLSSTEPFMFVIVLIMKPSLL